MPKIPILQPKLPVDIYVERMWSIFLNNISFFGNNRCSIEIGKDEKMDKQIKFSEQPTRVKIIYAAVLAVLCITAVVIGIVSVASKKDELPEPSGNPTISDGSQEHDDNKTDESNNEQKEEAKKPEKLTMVAPVVGEITKSHSLDMPVFSTTLNEWRVHTGIDISAEEGSAVYAAAAGKVSKVYSDPFLGKTVEITHDGGVVSVYSNLSNTGIEVKEGQIVASGSKIGLVGDTSLSELADEAHLHFAVKVNGVSVNPLDYISENSKQASLGINDL